MSLNYNYSRKDGVIKNIIRIIKFNIRKFYYKNNYERLNKICFNNSNNIVSFFQNNNLLAIDLLHIQYGCRNFNFNQGYISFERDLSIINEYYPNIFKTRMIPVINLNEDYIIYLKNTPNMINEGLFFLSLHYKNQPIYNLNFITLNDGILITCLQGCGSGNNIKEYIKNFTKCFFGLRPITFMIFYSFIFIKKLKLKYVYGVDDFYAISSFKRGKKRKGKILNIHNLDEIFKENCEVIEQFQGYKKLSFKTTPINEIPSNKRSMYKKRYMFLDNLILNN
ncbi:DUF535 family protein [Campylobacter sp. RM12651]|uniref:DUF535 family protein n=1 Tax=Campylobacter sp. RM12651 TaxID=1660079 RepID=UPI001EFAF825|nr:DUF535 family protein [Campylobacter sp. RM12651]ULO03338.1 hypothetical protein AVBRAN_0877 [Campylobacter sp. RM12651]